MRWQNTIKVSFRSILKNRMRSFLTSLGIIIGVAAVIIMVAIGEGAQKEIRDNIQTLGANLLMVFPAARNVGGVSQGWGSFNRLTMEDANVLERQARLVQGISPMIRVRAQVIGGGVNWSTTISGVSVSYLLIRDWGIAEGEFFTERDILSRNKVAVIGKTVADNLFPDQDPVGQRIRVNNTPMKIIGLLKEKGKDSRGQDQDDVLLSPSTTVLYRFRDGRFIDMIYASAVSPLMINAAQEEMGRILRDAHKINTGESDDFTVFNQSELIETLSATTRTLTLLLGAIAGVSLIVGGIGIMNIMLVSVTERTREIGIRMSIGARESDVMTQFLTEAVTLSMSGGLIGILVSLVGSRILTQMTQIKTLVNPSIVLVAVVFSAAVGIFFGFYPARKAAALHPIDALRYE
ncbi:MAG: multidrug ABC transporter substrate-binding protein [Candidatus Glassbacteria bacterium RIFCSPLOWO2_12_FULL_58_11]|uniref:Multidrug ABC transporter substrate-binding protein n=2 Tax=Candidatus Glassiibacteriota TaxID=1817805 RepID=A0A1F5YMU6_9BACT|nr:MAG: multidrug ABC transporter substrate-binding protein [Candidatus Glassbacteria bacterium GWA2_58_10]OGG01466.1 MAG: multidrug ABC transporter substrate-binding protein [Candidatus Glassbacteria bacterium RIFCSPLOWO2_12_FULL_58_11]